MLSAQAKENAMQTNVGTLDRAARVIVGLGLVAAAYAGALGPWAWIGIVPLVTGIVGTCPAYRVFGIDTCGLRRS
jgi:fatty acid desaturase